MHYADPVCVGVFRDKKMYRQQELERGREGRWWCRGGPQVTKWIGGYGKINTDVNVSEQVLWGRILSYAAGRWREGELFNFQLD